MILNFYDAQRLTTKGRYSAIERAHETERDGDEFWGGRSVYGLTLKSNARAAAARPSGVRVVTMRR